MIESGEIPVILSNAWAVALSQSQTAGNSDVMAILRGAQQLTAQQLTAQQLTAQQGETAAGAICLDVYETLSESAIPLPREVFAGPHDTRWGMTRPGQYGQLGGPPG